MDTTVLIRDAKQTRSDVTAPTDTGRQVCCVTVAQVDLFPVTWAQIHKLNPQIRVLVQLSKDLNRSHDTEIIYKEVKI